MHDDAQGLTSGKLGTLWKAAEIRKVPGDLDKWAWVGGQEGNVYKDMVVQQSTNLMKVTNQYLI